MTGIHPDLGPELRQLAQAILNRLDPAVRSASGLASSLAAGRGDGPGRCQQPWCPVCALAALVTGEQHPLLGVVAEHSVALLSVIRALLENADTAGGPSAPPPPPPADSNGGPPSDSTGGSPAGTNGGPGRYQHIPVTVQE